MNAENSKINVKDRRLFNADGTIRDESPQESSPPKENQAHDSVESIDFATFILSLASSAQISLGIVANPITGKQESNVTHAKQTIDIIGMLEEKTQNNLSAEESGLLKQILFQLRMQYVDINNKVKK